MRRVRRVEHARRIRRAAGDEIGRGESARRLCRRGRRSEGHPACSRRGRSGTAQRDRYRRARSRARWRTRHRLGGADWWRSWHRQIDPAAADARRDRTARARAVRNRRGKRSPGRLARAAPRHRARWTGSARRDLDRTHPRRGCQQQTRCADHRLDPDDLDRNASCGAGLGQPSAGVGSQAGALRQRDRYQCVPGRPRYQGRRHRWPACARAHGRRGAVLRGRGG